MFLVGPGSIRESVGFLLVYIVFSLDWDCLDCGGCWVDWVDFQLIRLWVLLSWFWIV